MILSSFGIASREIRKAAEQRAAQQAGEAVTPQHAACEAAVAGDGDEEARERARRIQHEADPLFPAVPEMAEADLDKAYQDAATIGPPGHWDGKPHPFVPQPSPVYPGAPYGGTYPGNLGPNVADVPGAAMRAVVSPGVAEPDLGKAFRDATPGPSAPAPPSAMSPYCDMVRPPVDLSAGHAAPSPGYQLPGTFNVPRASLNAIDFRRGPLAAGQAAPSPSYLEGP